MQKKKHLIVFDTRSETIKMATLAHVFQQESFETRVCVTAQLREMLNHVLDFFFITADYDLNLNVAEDKLVLDFCGVRKK